eukprot:607903-Pelagomonas_calceolata.AAC.1
MGKEEMHSTGGDGEQELHSIGSKDIAWCVVGKATMAWLMSGGRGKWQPCAESEVDGNPVLRAK